MKQVLRVENVRKTYQAKNGEIEALKNINFVVNEGEFVSIIGPSGCRKVYITFNNCRTRKKVKWKNLCR